MESDRGTPREPDTVGSLPGERFPLLFREALEAANARGNLAFDAQIAAVCRERGASRLLTLDRDFARFRGVTMVSPDDDPDN